MAMILNILTLLSRGELLVCLTRHQFRYNPQETQVYGIAKDVGSNPRTTVLRGHLSSPTWWSVIPCMLFMLKCFPEIEFLTHFSFGPHPLFAVLDDVRTYFRCARVVLSDTVDAVTGKVIGADVAYLYYGLSEPYPLFSLR